MIRNSNRELTMDVREIWNCEQNVVRALVMQALTVTGDGFLDMVMDHPSEYPNKESIEAVLQNGITEEALYALNETLEVLREKINIYMKEMRYTPRLREIHYNTDGTYHDIVVDTVVQDPTLPFAQAPTTV